MALTTEFPFEEVSVPSSHHSPKAHHPFITPQPQIMQIGPRSISRQEKTRDETQIPRAPSVFRGKPQLCPPPKEPRNLQEPPRSESFFPRLPSNACSFCPESRWSSLNQAHAGACSGRCVRVTSGAHFAIRRIYTRSSRHAFAHPTTCKPTQRLAKRKKKKNDPQLG